MAHMSCFCGASMSNVKCPSDNIIYVLTKESVEKALAYDSNIKLSNFIMNWDETSDSKKEFISEEFDFWYCTHCKRVYQCEIRIGGKILSVFKIADNSPQVEYGQLLNMKELMVFSDIEESNATENDPLITLKSFVDSLNHIRYFLSDDCKYVYGYDHNLKKISFVYEKDNLTE